MPVRSISCRPSLSRASFENRSDSALRPILRRPFGVSSSLPSVLLIEPGVLELLGQLGQLLEAAGRVVAQELAGPVDVDLGQRTGARGAAQHLLELVEVAELVEHLRRPRRTRAGPARRSRSCRSQPICGNSCWRWPPSWSICQRRSMSSRSCSDSPCSWARCSGVIELSIDCMAAMRWAISSRSSSRFSRVLREEVAEALHELLEGRLRLLARSFIASRSLRADEHVLHAGHRLGVHLGHRPGHLVEVALGQLLAQLVHQLVEPLAGLARGELVLLQLADHAGQVGRQHVELEVALGHDLVGDLLAAGVARLAGLAGQLVEPGPLGVEDLAERLGDLLVDAPEVVLLELVPPPPPQPLHQVAHAHELLAVAVLEALLHQAAQGRVQVAVVEEVVGDLLEDRLGVEVEADLGAVPPGVAEARSAGHRGHRTGREGSAGRDG